MGWQPAIGPTYFKQISGPTSATVRDCSKLVRESLFWSQHCPHEASCIAAAARMFYNETHFLEQSLAPPNMDSTRKIESGRYVTGFSCTKTVSHCYTHNYRS